MPSPLPSPRAATPPPTSAEALAHLRDLFRERRTSRSRKYGLLSHAPLARAPATTAPTA